jgi:hypothetical protein
MWDVTTFPKEKARLVGFWWGYAGGSIMPFVSKFDEWSTTYRVAGQFKGYDSTSSQKALAELAWQTGEQPVQPLGFDGAKKWMYINSAKVLMSKGMLIAPRIQGFEKQLRNYRLPDKKLEQDIVSAFCMAAHLMIPLYREEYPDDENTVDPATVRFLAETASRTYRPSAGRHIGRSR